MSIVSFRVARVVCPVIAALIVVDGVFSQNLRISEILAINDSGIRDEDGERSDWLEVGNAGAGAVDLAGWALSDDPLLRETWVFPGIVLAPGAQILVFASGKDRAIAGEELHASFRLAGSGEFLALIRPDGSVAQELDPYPEQREDISWGIAEDVETLALVSVGALAAYAVPASGAAGLAWVQAAFDDASWPAGPTGIGFDAGFQVVVDPDDPVNLARGGVATHSSQLSGFSASLGIDGDYSNFTHTASGQNLPATWELDLRSERSIASIVLHNRTSCCGSRLRDITISVLDGAGAVVYRSALLNPENVLGGGTAGPTALAVDFLDELGVPVVGRRVRVVRTPDPDLSGSGGQGNNDEADVLSLGEVEVWEGGAGFGPLIATDIEDAMLGVRASAYLRIPFDANLAGGFDSLVLRVKYDDGFVAYLNGVEIARRNAPAEPTWNSTATAERADSAAILYEEFDVTAHAGVLLAKGNVLAIHGLNRSAGDDDFLVVPELALRTVIADVTRYFRTPTPGAPNDPSGIAGFVADTVFSSDRGFYAAPFSVAISSATEGATIRHTLDGSAPTASRGEVYAGPIPISRTTILRAAAFKAGLEPTNVDTHTYIFLADIIASSLMRTSITRHAVWGPQMDDALRDLPSISLVTSGTINSANEIRTSVEWIDPAGGPEFQEDAGVKHYGGNVTNFDKKNFRVFFRGVFGARKLRFPLFAGFDRTIQAARSFDQFELRSGSHDMNQRGFYMSNRLCDDTMLDMGNLNPHGRFVHLYIDGAYWGQYHLRERWHDSMHAEYLGGEPEDYESINGNQNVGGAFGAGFPYDGDGSTWERAKSLRGNFDALRQWVDIAHYVDYMLLFNFGNSETEYRCVGPTVPGSGFKFYLNDADGFTRDIGNRLDVAGPGEFFSALRAQRHPDFMALIGDRIQAHFFNDGVLTPAKMRARLLERCAEVERAFIAEAARWDYRTPDSWRAAKDAYVNGVLPGRTATVLGYLRAAGLYPTLEAPAFSRHGGEVPAGFGVTVTAPVGEVWTMPDGSDPRLPGGALSPDALPVGEVAGTTVLASGAPVRVHIPRDGALGLAWTELGFDDSAWRAGTTGVGFETATGYEALIGTDVEDLMLDQNASAYMRVPFAIDDPSLVTFLVLRIRYDDGFIAYVNGVEVAARNAPGEPAWNSRATAGHSDSLAVRFETIEIGAGVGPLRRGSNILAIHGLNTTAGGGDFLVSPEIDVAEASGGVIIERTTTVRSRARNGASWSALSAATFYVDVALRVTELMYHPPEPLVAGRFAADDYEFVELKNIGDEAIELAGLRLAGGIAFDLGTAPFETLPPGELLVVASDLEAFASRYDTTGMLVAGEYRGNLSNAGDRVEIRGVENQLVLGFDFVDRWHPLTDGEGLSLVHIDPRSDRASWSDLASWRPSDDAFGTPGLDDSGEVPIGGWQRPGDANQDAIVDLSDAVALLRLLFVGQIPLPCAGDVGSSGNRALLDANGDAGVDVSDAITVLEYLFGGGTAPALGRNCVRIADCPSVCGF